MKVHQLTPAQWKIFAEDAHKITFGELKKASSDRIDYALLVVNEKTDLAAAYVTCRELDEDTVYWQFGGAMPETRQTFRAFEAYLALIEHEHTLHKRVTTLIENTNLPMLKMAMKVGFRVVGIRTYKGTILLEHLLEFEGA